MLLYCSWGITNGEHMDTYLDKIHSNGKPCKPPVEVNQDVSCSWTVQAWTTPLRNILSDCKPSSSPNFNIMKDLSSSPLPLHKSLPSHPQKLSLKSSSALGASKLSCQSKNTQCRILKLLGADESNSDDKITEDQLALASTMAPWPLMFFSKMAKGIHEMGQMSGTLLIALRPHSQWPNLRRPLRASTLTCTSLPLLTTCNTTVLLMASGKGLQPTWGLR